MGTSTSFCQYFLVTSSNSFVRPHSFGPSSDVSYLSVIHSSVEWLYSTVTQVFSDIYIMLLLLFLCSFHSTLTIQNVYKTASLPNIPPSILVVSSCLSAVQYYLSPFSHMQGILNQPVYSESSPQKSYCGTICHISHRIELTPASLTQTPQCYLPRCIFSSILLSVTVILVLSM